MTVDRGLFDHTGAQPPATRITIELPPEYIDKPDPGATPPYTDKGKDLQVLADIQTAVMRQYGGTARRLLHAFRQDVGLGDLAVNGRRAMLGEGVGMNYVSQFGNEAIQIYVSQDGVRKLIGEQTSVCMLVLYGDNKIAYIPMSKIASPSGSVTKKTLKTSDWAKPSWWHTDRGADFFIPVAQVKFSKTLHAMESAISTAGGIITIPDNPARESMFNTIDTLLKGVESSRNDISNPDRYYANLVMNGGSNFVYNEKGDRFEVTATGLTKKSDGDNSGGNGYLNVKAVTTDGGRYQGTSMWAYRFGYLSIDADSTTAAQNAAKNAWFLSPGNNISLITYGPGDPDYTRNNGLASASVPIKIQTYSKLGGLDKLSLASGTATATWQSIGGFSFAYTESQWGLTVRGTLDLSAFGNDSTGYLWSFGFPYALSAEMGKMYLAEEFYNPDNYSLWTRTFYTPYGQFGPYQIDMYNYTPWMYGWLHLSNGKNLMQAFVICDGFQFRRKIYLDGVDYGDKLAEAIGCALTDIRAAFLDISKADIDKLK